MMNDALFWLDERESEWQLDTPINRLEFVLELLKHAHKA